MIKQATKPFTLTASLERNKPQSGFDRVLTAVLVFGPIITTVVAVTLAGLGYSIWKWQDFALLGGFYMAASMGITIGYHRMLTHSSFTAHPIVRTVLLIFGVWAIQGGPVSWVAIHAKHHRYSDEADDPHSPTKNLYHSHMGWLFDPNRADPAVYAKAQMKDPAAMFVGKTAFWWAILGMAIPFIIGGWTGFLWGTVVRMVVVHHVTWSVNSLTHRWGSRPYKTGKDLSTNNVLVGILAMGEGWHNNHHAFPRSASHGLTRWQIDASAYIIRFMGALHLVRDIYKVPREAIAAKPLNP